MTEHRNINVKINSKETAHHYWEFHATPNPMCKICVSKMMKGFMIKKEGNNE